MQAFVYPLDKVVIENMEICLGMDKDSLFNLLGKGKSYDEKRYYYFDNGLAIDFDDKNKLTYIEFIGGIDGQLQPVIYGIPAFEVEADELLRTLKNIIMEELIILKTDIVTLFLRSAWAYIVNLFRKKLSKMLNVIIFH